MLHSPTERWRRVFSLRISPPIHISPVLLVCDGLMDAGGSDQILSEYYYGVPEMCTFEYHY